MLTMLLKTLLKVFSYKQNPNYFPPSNRPQTVWQQQSDSEAAPAAMFPLTSYSPGRVACCVTQLSDKIIPDSEPLALGSPFHGMLLFTIWHNSLPIVQVHTGVSPQKSSHSCLPRLMCCPPHPNISFYGLNQAGPSCGPGPL